MYVNIAVFDVPPESMHQQLSRALIGDRTCDLEFIGKFLLDISEVVCNNNYRILFKPKYSLSNYSVEYQLLLTQIKEKWSDKFIILSPYTRMGALIELAEVCLSFPYSSSRVIGEEFGKRSFYYVSESYRSEFETACAGSNINLIIGSDDLNKQLLMMLK